ncbi:enterochelin esterase domain-containing protein [Gordonia sp. (in: high G+C Gram-positive bacteria)]|uniref:enterochelin esterase domain-containing protein n=1 Tax=Gordonia sp. (in: high G+C Gram-positive bacteria) TaxID=84139 RepID=UPI003F966079
MSDSRLFARPNPEDRRLTTPPHTPRPRGVQAATSPSVDAVRADPSRVDEFYDRIVAEGAPLVEGDGDWRSFTWVHRGDANRVALVAGKLTDDTTVDDAVFRRTTGTDLWTLTLALPARWRGTYSLAVDDGSVAPKTDPVLNERRSRSLGATDSSRHDQVNVWYDLLALARPDPLAREWFRGSSVASGPDAPPVIATTAPERPGRLVPVRIAAAGGGHRDGHWVVPASAGADAAVLVLLDGDRLLLDGEDALDAWVHTHLAPNTVVLLLGHGGVRQRDIDLTCNPHLVADLRSLIEAAPVPVTADPARTAIQGSSLGGLSALFAQCVAPDRFGVSICQSGSFWWPNASSGYPAEWLTDVLDDSDVSLGVVHLSVGTDEWVLIEPVRRMRDVLVERAAVLDYDEFAGGHDAACWQAELPGVLARIGFG